MNRARQSTVALIFVGVGLSIGLGGYLRFRPLSTIDASALLPRTPKAVEPPRWDDGSPRDVPCPSEPAQSDEPIEVGLCDIVSRPQEFACRHIRLRATVLTDCMHSTVLIDSRCERGVATAVSLKAEPTVETFFEGVCAERPINLDVKRTATFTGRFRLRERNKTTAFVLDVESVRNMRIIGRRRPSHNDVAAYDEPQTNKSARYPNELTGYRLFQNAKWRQLTPLESTLDDVRRVLGAPSDPRDLANYTKPYPGDNAAEQPVFRYRLDRNWEALVYFGRHCEWVPADLRNIVADRVCSIELVPSKRRSFRDITFPVEFREQHVDAADAGWDEYADGSGLVYEVYTTSTPYGATIPGDLNRIVYGPSAEQIAKHRETQK